MLEILIKVIDPLIKAIELFSNKKSTKRKKEFGALLIVCYLRLIDVIKAAESILSTLEFWKDSKKPVSNGEKPTSWSSIEHKLIEQKYNLLKLKWALNDIAKEIYVLNPEIALDLYELILGKSSALSILITQISDLKHKRWEHYYPFNIEFTNVPIRDFIDKDKSIKLADDFDDQLFAYIHTLPKNVKVEKLMSSLENTSFVIEKIALYFEMEQPRSRLRKLKECAAGIRETMLKYYSIDEILFVIDDLS